MTNTNSDKPEPKDANPDGMGSLNTIIAVIATLVSNERIAAAERIHRPLNPWRRAAKTVSTEKTNCGSPQDMAWLIVIIMFLLFVCS